MTKTPLSLVTESTTNSAIPKDYFYRGMVIDENGKESCITEFMIQKACMALENNSTFYPSARSLSSASSNSKPFHN